MTSKKKAYELCNKFYEGSVFIEGHLEEKERAKERALICVDEMLKSTFVKNNTFNYWSEVKQEINKL